MAILAGLRILMLVSDAHGGFGGIAQYNRDVIEALAADPTIDRIVVVPRSIERANFIVPPKVRYDRLAAGGIAAFIFRSWMQALFGGRFDLVFCGHVNLAPVAAAICRLMRKPLVVSVHGTDVWTRPTSRLVRRSMKAAALILPVSKFTEERMRGWLAGPQPPSIVIPNAVRLEAFGMAAKNPELVARYGLAGKRAIMTLGRMAANERAKGFDEIIELMPRLRERCPDLVYICGGDGDDRPRLEAKALALGCADSVVFTGRIAEESKADHFRLADAYIHASRFEGFGIVLIEALACGIPVVGSTADASQEALLFGELGPAVDPADPDALSEAILAAIAQPRQVPGCQTHYTHEQLRRRLTKALTQVMTS